MEAADAGRDADVAGSSDGLVRQHQSQDPEYHLSTSLKEFSLPTLILSALTQPPLFNVSNASSTGFGPTECLSLVSSVASPLFFQATFKIVLCTPPFLKEK